MENFSTRHSDIFSIGTCAKDKYQVWYQVDFYIGSVEIKSSLLMMRKLQIAHLLVFGPGQGLSIRKAIGIFLSEGPNLMSDSPISNAARFHTLQCSNIDSHVT